ncbi:hypothetical protein HDA32_000893 [Spinactinospora alkalitolerans]|uniref:Uncharacterized protein n=1 Tax=Spinactinospora alkalitolerans TaxID=687207 RepID=A0A852TSQ7_9ACTN|nr:hypothetical protein [Spinactinospora alkalitolerans]
MSGLTIELRMVLFSMSLTSTDDALCRRRCHRRLP